VDYRTRKLVDSGLKGFIEVAYFGDTDGRLWKLKGLNKDSGWAPQPELLYEPENPRPIFHKPAVVDFVDGTRARRFILFGTGDEEDPNNPTAQDYFYEIEDREWEGGTTDGLDNDGDSEIDEDDEAGLGSDATHIPAWTAEDKKAGRYRKNWMVSLPEGEKVLSAPIVYYKIVYFTTYKSVGPCGAGESFLYGLTTTAADSTGNEAAFLYDFTDQELQEMSKKLALGASIASGPTAGYGRVYVFASEEQGSGGGGGHIRSVLAAVPGAELISWREGSSPESGSTGGSTGSTGTGNGT
jgi:Tfp pilus tip-associated adhesin PilY1